MFITTTVDCTSRCWVRETRFRLVVVVVVVVLWISSSQYGIGFHLQIINTQVMRFPQRRYLLQRVHPSRDIQTRDTRNEVDGIFQTLSLCWSSVGMVVVLTIIRIIIMVVVVHDGFEYP